MTEHVGMHMPPEGAICDFCSSPAVRWSFPARDFVRDRDFRSVTLLSNPALIRFDEAHVTHGSRGGWAACDPCYRLIARGDRAKLTRRAAKAQLRKHPEALMSLAEVIKIIRPLHDDFWANRQGTPIHHDHRPKADPTCP